MTNELQGYVLLVDDPEAPDGVAIFEEEEMPEAYNQGYNDYRTGSGSLYYESQGTYYRRLPLGGVVLEDDRVRAQQYIAGFCQGEADSQSFPALR